MFLLPPQATIDLRSTNNIELLHRLECRACPLNTAVSGKLIATGVVRPIIYILGDVPSAVDVREKSHFGGEVGQLLRAKIPRKFRDQTRFNNCARSRPLGNEAPDRIILECCRPSVVKDIEQSKPRAILGFGNVPLEWVSGFNGVTLWRGRRMPVKVGKHICWYYPLAHPAFLLRQRRGEGLLSEEERMFAFDIKRAFAEVENLPEPIVHTAEDVRRGTEVITEFGDVGVSQVREALAWATNQAVIGIDYETNCLRPYSEGAKILTAAVATNTRAIAFPFMHPEASWTDAELAEITSLWKKFLLTAKGSKVVHNLAFELEWTAVHFGVELVRAGRWEDTATQACIIDERKGERKPGCFSLEFLVQQYFGFNLKKLAALDRKNLENAPFEAVLQYNAGDAKYHYLLWEKQHAKIQLEGLEVPYELALRSVPTMVLTQVKGLTVNQVEVASLQTKYARKLVEAEESIRALSIVKQFQLKRNKTFNPLSNKDTLYIFKDMLERPEVLVEDKYTKKRRYSVDEKVLERVDHPLSKALLDLRHFNKRKSTYVDPLALGSPILYPDGCLHAQFNTIFAETGRTSCVRKGTLIRIPNKIAPEVPIERLKVGDEVYAVGDHNQLLIRRVTNVWHRGRRLLLRLWWSSADACVSGTLDLTADHRVRLMSGEYVAAETLTNGARCSSHLLRGVVVGEIKPLSEEDDVYDIEVEGAHNFIAGGVCVHNCDAPNLQNFPKRDGEAKEVRKQIVPPKGCVVLAFDYGQLEARTIALFTKDKLFCRALWENYDVHMEWAERLAKAYPARIGGKKNLADKKVMKNFRTDVKNQWTFPLFFGARVQSAAGYLKIPEEVLRPLYKQFWNQFSGVKVWQEQQLEFYHKNGYVECLTGRRRRGPLSLNQVLNSPVQGTAAAIVLDAMSRLSEIGDPELQPEINIHDDLTFVRVPAKRVDIIAERVITEMLSIPFAWAKVVPMTVEMSVGLNWLEMEEVSSFSSEEWGR